LRVVSDSGTLEPLCSRLVEQHPSQVAQYRSGKKGVFGFFVGQVMKKSGGKANPKLTGEIVRKMLEG
jgi:Asp-tRNA(Asn)/Glu-tRNA(Gln) amidotransferase B subunit